MKYLLVVVVDLFVCLFATKLKPDTSWKHREDLISTERL